jgi:hypothetical protein
MGIRMQHPDLDVGFPDSSPAAGSGFALAGKRGRPPPWGRRHALAHTGQSGHRTVECLGSWRALPGGRPRHAKPSRATTGGCASLLPPPHL